MNDKEENLVAVNLDQLGVKFQSKKEMWRILTGDLNAYLPESQHCTV
jgi:hypothetical protein